MGNQPSRACSFCGETYQSVRPKQQQFCSTACRDQHENARKRAATREVLQPRLCDQCAAEYQPLHDNQRWCSAACRKASLRKGTRKGPKSGTPQTAEHKAARVASLAATLAASVWVCEQCGDHYTPTMSAQRYCSNSCNEKVHRVKRYTPPTVYKQSPGQRAARAASTVATLSKTVRICTGCGDSFIPETPGQRYCSGLCSEKVRKSKSYVKNKSPQYLVPGEYAQRLETQGGGCAVCQRPPNGRKLCVDHDHRTGVVRGLLCSTCNTAIGLLQDDYATVVNAARYLLPDPPTPS